MIREARPSAVKEDLFKLLKEGRITEFNEARAKSGVEFLELKGANLSGANLKATILSYADLRSAELIDANLSYTNLIGANLSGLI